MKENRSVNRIMAILELISKHNEGLTLGQIYRELDIPKATVYDFLQTLYKADAIYYKDPRLKNYVIGSKMFAIGSVYNKNSNLIEAGQYDLKHFAETYGRTVFVTKRINDKIIYVYKYQPGNSRVVTQEEIGTITHDFKNTTVGQCYTVFDKKVKDVTFPDYDTIKAKRYLSSEDSNGSHINTLTVPVYNFENRVCGVLAASDLAQFTPEHGSMVSDFIHIAENISRKLGYLGDFND